MNGLLHVAVAGSASQRMTRRTWLWATAGSSAAAGLVAACGASETPTTTQFSAPVVLNVVQNQPITGPEGRSRMDVFLDWYDEKISLNLKDAEAATDLTKLKAMLAAGTVPDLMYVSYRGDPADLYTLGAIIDYDTELKTEKDWAKQKADMYPVFLETSMWAGKLVAMPGYGTCQAMIYNPGLLQKAGVAVPRDKWTWNDFLTSARRAMRPPDVWGLDLTWSYVFWMMWVGSAGVRPLSKDNRKLTLNNQAVIDATTFQLELVRSGVTPPESSPELFAKGTTVFEHQGSYRVPTLRAASAEFGVIHMPMQKEVFSSTSGHSMVVAKNIAPERRHAAALVAKWMNSPAPQAKMCIRSVSQPVSRGAAEHKSLRDYMVGDPQAKGFVDVAQYSWRWPNIPSFTKVAAVLGTAITDILGQKIGVKDGLARAERDGQPILDEDMRQADALMSSK